MLVDESVTKQTTERTICSVRQFSDRNPAFSQGALRYLIFNAKSNGLQNSGALVRLGRRVLIDESKFFKWLDDQQDRKAVQK